VDDHYYRRADEFFDDVKHYDTVDRNGPKIFVGEWATREGSPTTNMGAALGDAAWMTGMERNSDLIVMASYATVRQCEPRWNAVGVGPDRIQRDVQLRLPKLLCPGHVWRISWTEVPTSSQTGGGGRFFYSVTRDPAKGEVFLKLVNASSFAQPVEIDMEGASSVSSTGTLVSLSGTNDAETNTISTPTRIVPVKSTLPNTAAKFAHTVPPFSVQVIKLEAK